MPVWKSSSPVGSSASRIGFPLASGARSLPLLLAAQQLMGEVSRSLGEPDAIQHLARYLAHVILAGGVGSELDVLECRQRRKPG